MSDQLFTDGDVHQVNGQDLECVAASYQEVDGQKQNFVYHFRLKSELDAEREAAKALTQTDDSPEAVAAAPAPGELNQPEAPKEETQYVK
jgi:hypothetical protein